MDEERLDHLIAGYLAGTLPPTDGVELADLVEIDVQARQRFAHILLVDRLIPFTAPAAFDVPLVMRALPRGRDASRVARIVRPRRLPRRWRIHPSSLLAAGIAVAVMTTLWLMFAHPPRPSRPAGDDHHGAAPVVARMHLEALQGAVVVLTTKGEHPGRAGEALPEGCGVRIADAASGATIRFSDGTRLQLGTGTQVAGLEDGRADGMRLDLRRGRLQALVVKQPSGRTLTIATPQATATVVGTTFTLAMAEAVTLLTVDEGRVRLACAGSPASRLVEAGGFAETAGATISEGRTAVVTIDRTQVTGTSRFVAGFTHLDNGLLAGYGGNQAEAVRRAGALLARTATYQNSHLMAFGIPDPWDQPERPLAPDWSTLDARVRLAHDGGALPVITLCQAPWWMKGHLQPDGSTRLLTRADEWEPIAYDSRIRDDRIESWLTLVRAVAARYLRAPFHVRHFQVWDRLAGYHNPLTDDYDMDISSGDPAKPQARHGYTYLYNRTYDTLKDEAERCGIDPREVAVGGPGVPISTWRDPAAIHASPIAGGGANIDRRSLGAMETWLSAMRGADFICIHGDNRNLDGEPKDPFAMVTKFGDTVRWLRGLPATTHANAATLPIWWTKWSIAVPASGDTRSGEAMKAAALADLITAGVDVLLPWAGGGQVGGDMPLWTRTDRTDGGQALPWQATYARFRERFGAGTALLAATSPDPALHVLASASTMLLINLGEDVLLVDLGTATVRLAPYEIRWLDTPPSAP